MPEARDFRNWAARVDDQAGKESDLVAEEPFGLRQFPMLAAAMPTMQKAIATVEAHPSQ